MILKLKTGIEKNRGWKVIDNIKNIDYKYIDEPKELTKPEKTDIVYINTFPALPDKRIVEINMFYKNGIVEVIYTDNAVYILNDDGKTCDTINA